MRVDKNNVYHFDRPNSNGSDSGVSTPDTPKPKRIIYEVVVWPRAGLLHLIFDISALFITVWRCNVCVWFWEYIVFKNVCTMYNIFVYNVQYICVQCTIYLCTMYNIFVYNVQYICVQCTIYLCTMYNIFVYNVQYICVQCTIYLCKMYNIFVYNVHIFCYNVHILCTMYIYCVQCTYIVYNVHILCTMYIYCVQCTYIVYNVHILCTMYIYCVHCTMYIYCVQCTIYLCTMYIYCVQFLFNFFDAQFILSCICCLHFFRHQLIPIFYFYWHFYWYIK